MERYLSAPLHRIAQAIRRAWRWLIGPRVVLTLLVISVLGLPVVMWASLATATTVQMRQQADEISTLASGIRTYYADNVIARLQKAQGQAVYSENYRNVHGGIPIPATLSIELAGLIDNAHSDGRIRYDFISDYPFAKRVGRPLDAFEKTALRNFREGKGGMSFAQLERSWFGPTAYRVATPVMMRQACVTCHNSHPDSPKRDWKVGDVRGIQEVTVRGQILKGFGGIGYLVGYVGLVGLVSVAGTSMVQRQASTLRHLNQRLLEAGEAERSMTERLRGQLEELGLLGAVVENSTFGISMADMRLPDAPLVYVNEAFTKITGYSRERAIGFNCRFLRGPDTDARLSREIAAAIRRGDPFNCEILNYRLDGTRFWNRLTLYPVSIKDGSPEFYVGYQVDITTIKECETLSATEIPSIIEPIEEALHSAQSAMGFHMQLREGLSSLGAATDDLHQFMESEHRSLRRLIGRVEEVAARLCSLRGEKNQAMNAAEPGPVTDRRKRGSA